MHKFNYYTAEKALGDEYLRFPIEFLTNNKYKGLSSSAKIAYTILRDRLQYSIQNNWIDEDYNAYLVYTNEDLVTLLNKSESIVIKITEELEKAKLLLKVKSNNPDNNKLAPNRLYLASLVS